MNSGERAVADDPALLAALLEDARRAGPLWRATPYWEAYCERIVRELRAHGLADFRRNPGILKGYAEAGGVEPTLPRAAWKRAIWRTTERLPVVSTIVAEYRRLVAAQSHYVQQYAIRHARHVLDAVAQAFPRFRPPAGVAAGNPAGAFDWRGHRVSADWAIYVARAADFYRAIGDETVEALIEIGPGIGLSALAHKALNPALRLAVHVDIVPVLYVSTQFLRACPEARVIGYDATRGRDRIDLPQGDGLAILQIPPWQLAALRGAVDYFFNAYSFQEMEPEVVAGYAAELIRLARRGGLIHSSIAGHPPGAGGQRAPVTMALLESLFAPAYPLRSSPGGFWPRFFDGPVEEIRLFRR